MRDLLLAGSLLVLTTLCVAADAPSPQDIRDSLQAGNTVKAARLAEEAIGAAGADSQSAELRYLLFKAHVLDMQPNGGKLYKQKVGKASGGLAHYQKHLDAMEGDLQAEGV